MADAEAGRSPYERGEEGDRGKGQKQPGVPTLGRKVPGRRAGDIPWRLHFGKGVRKEGAGVSRSEVQQQQIKLSETLLRPVTQTPGKLPSSPGSGTQHTPTTTTHPHTPTHTPPLVP